MLRYKTETRPGLVTLYDIRPGNRAGQFLQPQSPHGAKPGLGSLKVIENDTMESGTHDFLLTFHSNDRPISHHFRDKRRFPS